MALELRDLRCLVVVAEEGHITRAAERLAMHQPSLTTRIKAMERRLELQLFRRKPRGVELTEAGRVLVEEARVVIARIDAAVASAKSVARGLQGLLRIAMAPTAPFLPFVPRCIRAYRASRPEVTITVSEGLSHEVREELADMQCDVAFVRVADMRGPGLVVDVLMDEPLIAALPRSHALARRGGDELPSLKRLAADPFVLFGPPGTGIHDATLEACEAAGFRPIVAQHAPRVTSTLGFVAAGMGVALVPASMRRVTVDGVAYRSLPASVKARVVLGIASRRHDPSAAVRNFVSFVKRSRQ